MPRTMWKDFHLCFPSNLMKPSTSPSDAAAASEDPNRPSILLINNFSYLYDDSTATAHRITKRVIDVIPSPSTTTTTTFTASTSTTGNSSSSSLYESDSYGFASDDSPPLDLTAVLASRRFFFSSPGRSNSITDSPDLRPRFDTETSTAKADSTAPRLLTGGSAVKQYVQSPDPYNDFRRSMQEMVDAITDAGDVHRYEFLHELLLSYLSLNAADTHKFIIRAFADVLVSLLSDGHREN